MSDFMHAWRAWRNKEASSMKIPMNDLSGAGDGAHCRPCGPIPAWALLFVLAPLLLVGLAFSILVLVVVHSAAILVCVILVSLLVLLFILWNATCHRRNGAIVHFVDRLPASDLLTASEGQLVKLTGVVSCGDVSLQSAYEKMDKCVYTSTLLYEYGGTWSSFLRWNLTYIQRFAVDFYITDPGSGATALVKAGCNSRVIPLVHDDTIVRTTGRCKELSSTLKNWLEERRLPSVARWLRLEEGCVNEGSTVMVVGVLSRKGGGRGDVLAILPPPPESVSTGFLFRKLLLPVEVDGLILMFQPRR